MKIDTNKVFKVAGILAIVYVGYKVLKPKGSSKQTSGGGGGGIGGGFFPPIPPIETPARTQEILDRLKKAQEEGRIVGEDGAPTGGGQQYGLPSNGGKQGGAPTDAEQQDGAPSGGGQGYGMPSNGLPKSGINRPAGKIKAGKNYDANRKVSMGFDSAVEYAVHGRGLKLTIDNMI